MEKALIFIETQLQNKDAFMKPIIKVSKTNTEIVIANTAECNADEKLLLLLYAVTESVLYKQPDKKQLEKDEKLQGIYSTLSDLVTQIEDYRNTYNI